MTLGPDEIVRRADVLWRSVIDGVLIRRLGDDEEVLLEGSGVALWQELAVAVTVETLVARLAATHGTAPTLIDTDLGPVLDDLLERGVVVRG